MNTDGKVRVTYNAGNLLSSSGNFSKLRTILLRDLERVYRHTCWPGSVVGIATAYWLDGPVIESRWGARFFAPVKTGSEAHPASCTMGTGSFPGVRCGRGVTLTPHPLLVPRSKIE